MGGIEDLRRSVAWNPKDEGAVERLQRALTREIADAVAVRDRDRSVRLDAELQRLGLSSPIEHLWLPARRAGAQLRDTVTSGQMVVFAEADVDDVTLWSFLDEIPEDASVILERRRGASPGPDPLMPRGRALEDLGRVGMADDMALCEQTDAWAARLRAALPEITSRDRPSLAASGYLDLLDLASFEIDDRVWAAGRKAVHGAKVIAEGTWAAIVFVGSGDSLTQALRSTAIEHCPSATFFVMLHDPKAPAYGQVKRLVGLSAAPPRPTSALIGASDQDESPPRTTLESPARAATALSAWDPKGPMIALPAPGRVHAPHLAAVLRELPSDRRVVVLPHPAKKAQSNWAPLAEVAMARGDTINEEPLAPLAWTWGEEARIDLSDALAEIGSLPGHPSVDVSALVRRPIEDLVSRRLRAYAIIAKRLHDLIVTISPSVVIVSPDRTPPARIAIAVARKLGVPSVFPQGALLSASARYKPLQADFMTVSETWTRDLMVEHFGASADQLFMAGLTEWEELASAAEQVGVARERGRVLLILQRAAPEANLEMIEPLLLALHSLETARLTVRMHPGEHPAHRAVYQDVIDRSGLANRVEIEQHVPLIDTLERSDVLVSLFSTVVFAAAILGRPAICANFTGHPLPVPFGELGLALEVDGPLELQHALREVLNGGPLREELDFMRERFFEENAHLRRGKSSRAIGDFLERVARKCV